MADIIAAVATAPQTSAIGVVRLSGDGCIALTDRVFFIQCPTQAVRQVGIWRMNKL